MFFVLRFYLKYIFFLKFIWRFVLFVLFFSNIKRVDGNDIFFFNMCFYLRKKRDNKIFVNFELVFKIDLERKRN